MRGRNWLNYFMQACNELEDESDYDGDEEWTEFMGKVLDKIAEEMNCTVIRHKQIKDESSGEYLNIDAFFIDNVEYDLPIGIGDYEDPFVLPRAVVELENSFDVNKITYCLWKILCIRSPIRALVCYQKGDNNVKSLSTHLEDVIWQKGLMKDDNGDLLVIIGEDKTPDGYKWGDYFTVFEWRNDRLEKVEGFEW